MIKLFDDRLAEAAIISWLIIRLTKLICAPVQRDDRTLCSYRAACHQQASQRGQLCRLARKTTHHEVKDRDFFLLQIFHPGNVVGIKKIKLELFFARVSRCASNLPVHLYFLMIKNLHPRRRHFGLSPYDGCTPSDRHPTDGNHEGCDGCKIIKYFGLHPSYQPVFWVIFWNLSSDLDGGRA